MTENECLQILKQNMHGDEVVYELLRERKRSAKEIVVDLLCESVFFMADRLKSSLEKVYLVASEDSGKIYIFENGKEVKELPVTDWKKEDKEKFRYTHIDGMIYRKYRKLNI